MDCVVALQGDGTVTYQDPFSAASAVQWFNGKEFKGVGSAITLDHTTAFFDYTVNEFNI